ncbi:hypothetical protein EVAR_86273_1 [Eumeta japonica]|uniref:Uncharacterized protein n=1 Tax=Eumeta variegata TaxID=151549 RepID=A0A4C1UD76_EUMVA|nr:hypothetical protein EVAR_86273_1 [Eumeta japonica]
MFASVEEQRPLSLVNKARLQAGGQRAALQLKEIWDSFRKLCYTLMKVECNFAFKLDDNDCFSGPSFDRGPGPVPRVPYKKETESLRDLNDDTGLGHGVGRMAHERHEVGVEELVQ